MIARFTDSSLGMAYSPDGEYVLHTDHAEAMAGKDAEIERLRGALETIAAMTPSFGLNPKAKMSDPIKTHWNVQAYANYILSRNKDHPNAHA